MMNITSCDIEGTYKGNSFVIRNFSTGPIEASVCSDVAEVDNGNDTQYYSISHQDYAACQVQYGKNDHECDQFLRLPLKGETADQYTYRNETRYVVTPEYNECQKKADSEDDDCLKNYGQIMNKTDIEKDPVGISPARSCKLQFSIPPDNQTLRESANQTIPAYTPQNPIESLYCGILSLFGAGC